MASTLLHDLQNQCELGQRLLMQTDYLQAQAILETAEARAWIARDWDTLSRLYFPLQETRRQIRQRCCDGLIRLDLLANEAAKIFDANELLRQIPSGQLLLAGWKNIEPARTLRALARQNHAYVETFLAAICPLNDSERVIAIVPTDASPLNIPSSISRAELPAQLPPGSLIFTRQNLPANRPAAAEWVMLTWERLHQPFLAKADAEVDLIKKIDAYRTVIRIDPGCELAHQRLAAVARQLSRKQ